jgi:urea transport system substrate-binding protein
MSIDTPANKKFITNFNSWLAKTKVPGIIKKDRVTCSPMVLSYNGVYLWKAAVEKAKSFEPEKVMKALESSISFDGPGGKVTTQKNHHLTKTVYIGETLETGQFAIVETMKDVFGEPFLKGTFKK